MADMPSNTPVLTPVPTPAPTRSNVAPNRGTSKLSLLLAFAAGAAASWIIMQANDDDPVAAPTSVAR